MTKIELPTSEWRKLHESLTNSVGRSRMEKILIGFIIDSNDSFGDTPALIRKMGLEADYEAFTNSVAHACQRVTNDELVNLVFDAIVLDGELTDKRTFKIGEQEIDTLTESLRNTTMLIDMLITENAPHQIRDYHEDEPYNFCPVKYLKGEAQSFSLSENDSMGAICIRFSKNGVEVAHDNDLDADKIEMLSQLKDQLIGHMEAYVEREKAYQAHKVNQNDLGVEF